MKIIDTEIEGVKIVEPQVFGDARGWFVEQYNAERYKAAGIDADFVQVQWYLDNEWWWGPIHSDRYSGQRLGTGNR